MIRFLIHQWFSPMQQPGNITDLLSPAHGILLFQHSDIFGYISKTITGIATTDYNTTSLNIKLEPAETLNIYGTITNGIDAMPVDSAKIEIINTPLSPVFTNSDGIYQLSNIMEGNYTIRITKEGFASILQNIYIRLNDTVFNFSIYPSITIGFETGDFTELDFSFAGNADWQTEQQEVFSGSYSAKSGSISNQQSTVLQLNIDVLMDGVISFYRKVSSESGYDFLSFYIDNIKLDEWSGEQDWYEESFAITAGEHTVSWKYIKDYSTVSGADAAWIDNIVLPVINTTTNYPPVFVSTPVNSAIVNREYLYSVLVSDLNSTDTLTIEILKKPNWLSFVQNANTSATLSGTPNQENIGIDTVSIVVTDKIDTVLQNFTINVNPSSVYYLSENLNNINIFPNPTENNADISFYSPGKYNFKIQIFNTKGELIFTEFYLSKVGTNQINLNTSKLTSGIYFLKIFNNQQKYQTKFIKLP
ncbi:MAG: T9SS type A sorting domain-containing protein [Chlorobi bacterium]|nr:T9SS type A sorting domain-containing protein [Chlorobiota bacterium]